MSLGGFRRLPQSILIDFWAGACPSEGRIILDSSGLRHGAKRRAATSEERMSWGISPAFPPGEFQKRVAGSRPGLVGEER